MIAAEVLLTLWVVDDDGEGMMKAELSAMVATRTANRQKGRR